MVAGLATLRELDTAGLVERSARMGELLLERTRPLVEREVVRDVRGLGLMWAIEFEEPPGGSRTWKLLERIQPGLFSQLVVVPLFRDYRILSQVAGHGLNVLKAVPPLVVTAEDVRRWKAEFPSYISVGYVNTTAEVKAELDYCCTSGNVLDVIDAIPEDKGILFLPDFFLGAHVRRMRPHRTVEVWMGECHVHKGIRAETLNAARERYPDAEVLVHPECGCAGQLIYEMGRGDIRPEGLHLDPAGKLTQLPLGWYAERGGCIFAITVTPRWRARRGCIGT